MLFFRLFKYNTDKMSAGFCYFEIAKRLPKYLILYHEILL